MSYPEAEVKNVYAPHQFEGPKVTTDDGGFVAGVGYVSSGKTYQEKTVNITSNTTTVITPDTDKALTKVTVTTDIPNTLYYTEHVVSELVTNVIYFTSELSAAGTATCLVASDAAAILSPVSVTVSSVTDEKYVASYTLNATTYTDVDLTKVATNNITL